MSVHITVNCDDQVSDAIVAKLRSELMPFIDEIRAEIQTLKDGAATEHEQHLAILAALEGKVARSLTEEEWEVVKADFADARAAMGSIVPDEPPPAPEPLPEEG